MFLLHIVQTSAARTEPSACLNRLQRIMRPQHTGTHTVEVSAVIAHPGKASNAQDYTPRSSWGRERELSRTGLFVEKRDLGTARCLTFFCLLVNACFQVEERPFMAA